MRSGSTQSCLRLVTAPDDELALLDPCDECAKGRCLLCLSETRFCPCVCAWLKPEGDDEG